MRKNPVSLEEVTRAARLAVAHQHDWPLLVRRIAETIAGRLGCEFVEPADPAGPDEEDDRRVLQGAPAAGTSG